METVFGLRLVNVMRAIAHLQRAAACLNSTRLILITHASCTCSSSCSKLGAFVAVAVAIAAAAAAITVLLIYTIIT